MADKNIKISNGARELPKAYEPSSVEDGIYKKWEESGAFNPDKLELAEAAKPYSIVMPPPNVTGTLHMGHAAMLALEDILTRFHRMKGERALWIPGTDHAAIATQTKVEKIIKEEGTDRHKLGREKFLERVRKFAQDSHDTIVNQCKKMGSSCDWSREAYTLDDTRTKAVRSVFKLMYDDGLIFRGDRIVNWCPRCHSTLADDEVEYKEQQNAKFYTFKYDKDFPFAISTTRPETKLGDTAVAVNPKDERYSPYIGKTIEADFVGVKLRIKVIGDYKVDPAFGTGALGVTPAHSAVDWQMAEEQGLEIIKVIDEDGNIRSGFGDYSGLPVKDARRMIVEKLEARGLIEKEEEINNKLSICYRCSTPIEPLPSLQWFVDVDKKIPGRGKTIKELAIEAVRTGLDGDEEKKIRIYPERFEKDYFRWMDNLHNWCISRQIWFGHRIPMWYQVNSDLAESFYSNPNSSHRSFTNHTSHYEFSVDNPGKSDGKENRWIPDTDTLDTWFSSGLWTFSTLASNPDEIRIEDGKLIIDSEDFRNFHPTAVLETGYDILFFWVARMIIMTTYAIGDIPFKDVYLHGLVRDDKGKKMSKSLGNVIDPLDMIAKYGTDATRLSLVVGSAPGNDMNLSEEKIAGFRNLTNKIWNIARFVLSSYELKVDYKVDIKNLTEADNWILIKFQAIIKEVTDDLDNYRFSQAGERLREFTWDDLADWYLEVAKFEKSENKDDILSYILLNLLKLWHPFIPFVTEGIWSELGISKMLIIENWPQHTNLQELDKKKYLTSKDLFSWIPFGSLSILDLSKFTIIKNIITAIRNARAENKVEPAKKIKAVIYAGKNKDFIESQSVLVRNLRTGLEELEVKDKGEKLEKAIYITVGDIEIYLLGAIDEAKEKIRITKEVENLSKQIKATETKLSNQDFAARAPEQVVAKEKEKLEAWKMEIDKLEEQLKKM